MTIAHACLDWPSKHILYATEADFTITILKDTYIFFKVKYTIKIETYYIPSISWIKEYT